MICGMPFAGESRDSTEKMNNNNISASGDPYRDSDREFKCHIPFIMSQCTGIIFSSGLSVLATGPHRRV